MAARNDVVLREALGDADGAAEVDAQGAIPLGNSKLRVSLHFNNANKFAENGEFDRAIEEFNHIQKIIERNWRSIWLGDSNPVIIRYAINFIKRLYNTLVDKAARFCAVALDNGLSEAELREAIEDWKATRDELTARENIAHRLAVLRPDLPPTKIAAVSKLQARYERRLCEVVLPPTTPAEATAASELSGTFYDLQKLQRALGLPVMVKPERIGEAKRTQATYRRHHDEAGNPIFVRPRGRPRRVAAAADAAPSST